MSDDIFAKARSLIEAFEGHRKGVGVFVVDGRMIDALVVARARTIVAKAETLQTA